MRAVSVILFSFFVFVQAGSSGDHPMWSYEYETQWPGYCRSGTQQSPINIMTRDTMEDKFEAHIRGPLEFHGYDRVNLQAENNEHTLVWNNVDYPTAPVMTGGPLRGNYTFRQFHLHWLSEHAVDGMKYALEIHFVHMKQGLSIDEALARDDGVAVFGVMCEVRVGEGSGDALSEIIKDVPNVLVRGARPEIVQIVDVTRLFSPNPQSYFTYHGSLTTPGCQEVVTWMVMEKPIAISDEQFKLISKVDVGTISNYRSLQPVNRVVYRVTGNPVASCAHLSSPTFLATLAALVNCFSSQLGSAMKKAVCVLYSTKRRVFGSDSGLKECAKILNN